MRSIEYYRAKAAESSAFTKSARDPGEARRLAEQTRSFTDLADNEQWLAEHAGQVVTKRDPLTTTEDEITASEGGRRSRSTAGAPSDHNVSSNTHEVIPMNNPNQNQGGQQQGQGGQQQQGNQKPGQQQGGQDQKPGQQTQNPGQQGQQGDQKPGQPSQPTQK